MLRAWKKQKTRQNSFENSQNESILPDKKYKHDRRYL
jgi:hypothetical protein